MARLLCAVGGVAGLHQPGDVIAVFDDAHVFGTHEDKDQWTAAGNDPTKYPGIFYIVDCPDLSLTDAQQYVADETGIDANGEPIYVKFRRYTFNVIAAERRVADGRPRLQDSFKITRKHVDITGLFALRP